MTVKITTDVFCDCCRNWVHGTVWLEPERRQARRLAHELGWITCRSVGGGPMLDICPGCQEAGREPLTKL